ncbi:MAG: hypothetical protein KJO54_13885 [Gammaproteobacteria bacterium]|nr:hypothetical protein [Gammaproteobacteria bacterium]NNF60114.1 hypothetical protein [Gammaproteobacteria bacterium]NNM21526.1 hypothetical protein [Gammaproteobacteria bacterium]
MTLMLNGPGEEVAVPPAAEKTEKQESAPLSQILLIVTVALYLFGVTWLYVKLPWLALGATVFALAVVIAGAIAHTVDVDDDAAP